MTIRRTVLGTLAFLILALLVLSPFKAHANQTWDPVKEKPDSRIAIEKAVSADESNQIQSAFEKTLDGSEATRYVYVGRLPETFDLEAAARQVAETWKLDRTKDSLLFYDELGQHAFIWPATEANAKTVSELPTVLNASDFAGQFQKLYTGSDKPSSETQAVEKATDQLKPLMPLLFVVIGVVLFTALIRLVRY